MTRPDASDQRIFGQKIFLAFGGLGGEVLAVSRCQMLRTAAPVLVPLRKDRDAPPPMPKCCEPGGMPDTDISMFRWWDGLYSYGRCICMGPVIDIGECNAQRECGILVAHV